MGMGEAIRLIMKIVSAYVNTRHMYSLGWESKGYRSKGRFCRTNIGISALVMVLMAI